jgi:hypothetical protein
MAADEARVAVDTDEQLITAVDVMAGSARDADDALKLVEESEAATGVEVEAALGDAAYGSAETRRQVIDGNRTLIAKSAWDPRERPLFHEGPVPDRKLRPPTEAGRCRGPHRPQSSPPRR